MVSLQTDKSMRPHKYVSVLTGWSFVEVAIDRTPWSSRLDPIAATQPIHHHDLPVLETKSRNNNAFHLPSSSRDHPPRKPGSQTERTRFERAKEKSRPQTARASVSGDLSRYRRDFLPERETYKQAYQEGIDKASASDKIYPTQFTRPSTGRRTLRQPYPNVERPELASEESKHNMPGRSSIKPCFLKQKAPFVVPNKNSECQHPAFEKSDRKGILTQALAKGGEKLIKILSKVEFDPGDGRSRPRPAAPTKRAAQPMPIADAPAPKVEGSPSSESRSSESCAGVRMH